MAASTKPEAPVVLVKWYDYAKWVLERVESFPKNQKYVLGQRLSNQAMEVLELLVEAAYSREKLRLLATANRKMEVVRWAVPVHGRIQRHSGGPPRAHNSGWRSLCVSRRDRRPQFR